MHFEPPFAEWLKQRRRGLALTQEQLAQRVSYSVDAIRKYESGATQPSRQAAELLAVALEVPPDQRAAFIAFARGLEVPRINNLPHPATSLVGRDSDIAAVLDMLRAPHIRLVTLVGPPGVGKTRLAIEVAHRALSSFQQGACFVPLAHITQPEHVPGVVGDRLGLTHDHAAGVLPFLRDRQLLLVLDNLEQVLDAAAHIAEWLNAAPALNVLVTSRAVLRLSAEHAYPVEPLSLPDMQRLPAVRELQQVPAVTLFMQRAQAAKPSVTLTPENARDIATICNYLDGLPLALELAAGRVRMFTPHTLADRLNHVVGARLHFLDQGSRDLPKHQQTLRDAIAWSHALLAESEQRLLRRLGVFVNGFTLEAAQAVCAEPDQSPEDITAHLQTLVDHSLVQMREGFFNQPRYILLESLRDFAMDQLMQHGELELVRRQHARYFSHKCDWDPNSPTWFDEVNDLLRWVASERANLAAAKQASRNYDDDPDLHLTLTNALAWLVAAGDMYLGLAIPEQYYEELEWALARTPNLRLAKRAAIIGNLGNVALGGNTPRSTLDLYEEATALSHQAGAFEQEAHGLGLVGACYGNDYDKAESLYMQALRIYEQHGNKTGILHQLHALGTLAVYHHNYARASELLNQSLEHGRRHHLNNVFYSSEADILNDLGCLAYLQKDYVGACQLLERALGCFSPAAAYHVTPVIMTRMLLARAYLAHGELDTAEQHLHAYTRFVRDYSRPSQLAVSIHAQLAQLRGDVRQITRLAGYLNAHPPSPPILMNMGYWLEMKVELDQLLAQAHAGLNDPALAAAWQAGQALSDAEALDEVL